MTGSSLFGQICILTPASLGWTVLPGRLLACRPDEEGEVSLLVLHCSCFLPHLPGCNFRLAHGPLLTSSLLLHFAAFPLQTWTRAMRTNPVTARMLTFLIFPVQVTWFTGLEVSFSEFLQTRAECRQALCQNIA